MFIYCMFVVSIVVSIVAVFFHHFLLKLNDSLLVASAMSPLLYEGAYWCIHIKDTVC